MFANYDQSRRIHPYIHLGHLLQHDQKVYGLDRAQDLRFQLNLHLILDILQLILLFEQLQLNE